MGNKGNVQSNNKVERTNTGNRGARRRRMKPSDLVMLGKGQFATIKSVTGPAWQGVSSVSVPFDAKQAQINIDNGWC